MSQDPGPSAPPVPLDASVARRMSRQPRRDTAPEVALRRELHRRGLRFRVDWPLPGLPRRRADVAFTRKHVAVFIDGCFWHACPEHRTAPASNADWWAAKLDRNVSRDRDTDEHLRRLGWTVLRFWEHEDPVSAAGSVEAAVRGATDAGPAPPPTSCRHG
ncbi:very short patch repair endonuclease [Blastococcus sp. SYSU DS1024]